MYIQLSIKCKCGKYFKENVPAPYPNFMADSAGDSASEEWEELYCPECGEEITAHIVNSLYGADVNVPDVDYFDWEELHIPESEEDIAWIFETGTHYEIYELSISNLRSIANLEVTDPQRITLHTMVHSQIIASLEAYLAATFIKSVLDSDDLTEKLVTCDGELAKQKFSLKEIYSEMANIKKTVAIRLKEITFHNVAKVKPLYQNVLGVDFGDISWLGRAVEVRHDCTHRNGYDIDGNIRKFTTSALIDLANMCDALVSKIEKRLIELEGLEF